MKANGGLYSILAFTAAIGTGCYLMRSAQEEEMVNVIRRDGVVIKDSLGTKKCLVDFIYNEDVNRVPNIGADTLSILGCRK